MGRTLSGLLVLVRLVQILGSFIPGALNGWLLYYISAKKLGPSQLMLVLELLAAASFVYASLSLLTIHTRERSRRTACMVCSVCCDVVFCFVGVTIISLLSFAGLPSNCSGLTLTTTWLIGDKANPPPRGYTTNGFSNEQEGHRGQLDKFCAMERGFFFCAVLIILAYITSIIISVLRICHLNYTRNSKIQHLLDERDDILKLDLKMQTQELRSQQHSPALVSQPPAAAAPGISRAEEAAILSSMTRATAVASASNNNNPPMVPSSGLTGVAVPPAFGAASSPSNAFPPAPPGGSALHLSPADVHANLAMVSDGSRYNPGSHAQPDVNQLPPYSPGNQRLMHGHGHESNEIRLSDYVKGETRAQDMKDGSTFQ